MHGMTSVKLAEHDQFVLKLFILHTLDFIFLIVEDIHYSKRESNGIQCISLL